MGRLLRCAVWAVVGLAGCCGLWLGGRALLLDQFVIPTESMVPTLLPGDRVIVDKTRMGARLYTDLHFDPRGGQLHSLRTRGTGGVGRNDVVVFNFPHHEGRVSFVINNVYCKRCVALPGDTLSIVDGHYRNNNFDGPLGLETEQQRIANTPDSLIYEPALHTLPWDDHLPWTMRNFGPLYIPRRGDIVDLTPREGTLYRMLLEWETGKTIAVDWECQTVLADGQPLPRHRFAHNYYFMAGDNAIDSNDSRYWGLVPEEYIVGVVKWVSYSVDPQTGRKRKERTWMSVR